jgi:AraC-like DNA-binding protein
MLRQVFPPEPKQKNYPRVLRTAGTRWEYLGDLFRTGVEEFEGQEPGWEAAVLGNTTHLMAHLRRAVLDQSAHPPKAEKPDLVERVLAYVEGNLAERITLADAARQFYVSESTISQSFRKKMGVSFYRCVTQRRLIAAKTLIGEGVLLEDVAGKVGFSDYSSFYRAFKQEYGISPRQYRNLQTQPPVDPPGFMT